MILTKDDILKTLMQVRDSLKQGNVSHGTRRIMTLMKKVSNPDTTLANRNDEFPLEEDDFTDSSISKPKKKEEDADKESS